MRKIYLLSIIILTGCVNKSEKEFIGYYTYGHETAVFKQCNEQEYFWLNGNPNEVEIINNASLGLSESVGKPYQAIYVKFSGHIDNREPVGFEEEADGLIFMDELIEYSIEKPSTCK